jgi:hypothetical protein
MQYKLAGVSEESIASIFRVEEVIKQTASIVLTSFLLPVDSRDWDIVSLVR